MNVCTNYRPQRKKNFLYFTCLFVNYLIKYKAKQKNTYYHFTSQITNE